MDACTPGPSDFGQLEQILAPPMGPSSLGQLLSHRLDPREKIQGARMNTPIRDRFELERTANGSFAA